MCTVRPVCVVNLTTISEEIMKTTTKITNTMTTIPGPALERPIWIRSRRKVLTT